MLVNVVNPINHPSHHHVCTFLWLSPSHHHFLMVCIIRPQVVWVSHPRHASLPRSGPFPAAWRSWWQRVCKYPAKRLLFSVLVAFTKAKDESSEVSSRGWASNNIKAELPKLKILRTTELSSCINVPKSSKISCWNDFQGKCLQQNLEWSQNLQTSSDIEMVNPTSSTGKPITRQ